MVKFVFLVNDDGYRKYTYNAAKDAGASVPSIGQGVFRKLFEIHNAEPLNRIFELPLKQVWFQRVVDESKLKENDEIFFIMYESFHMTYSRKLIKYYKKKYKKSRFIYFFTNPVGEYNLRRLNRIRDLLDQVFSFNLEDVKRYNFCFLEADPFLLPEQEDYEPKTDVFFVGANKGRLEILINVFEKLTKRGLICDFWITDVPEEMQKYTEKIHYNQQMSYEEVLRHDADTRCILEVLQDGKSYSSIRTIEAIQYHKKVLTMNETVKDQWFYNRNIIQVFHNADEIDPFFIRKEVRESEYDNIQIGSFKLFEEFIVNAMKEDGNRMKNDRKTLLDLYSGGGTSGY